MRSLHIYVAVFERNHICVAESLENLAVCRFAPTAHEYNQQLRKLSTLKLELDSKASRVVRCEAREELRREALTKLKKTPGFDPLCFYPPRQRGTPAPYARMDHVCVLVGRVWAHYLPAHSMPLTPSSASFPHPRRHKKDRIEGYRGQVGACTK